MARRWLEFCVMTTVGLVVAHNLVFVLAYGVGAADALARTGHGDAWWSAVAVVLVAAVGLLLVASWRLHRLGVLAHDLGRGARRLDVAPEALGRDLAWLWLRLTGSIALAFVVQENLEHLQVGAALPGLGALGSREYPDALLVLAGVALVVACVGTLVRSRRRVLLARIAAAIRRLRFRPGRSAPRGPLDPDVRPRSMLGCARAVRAPPHLPAR
jgi:hypothetical protein